MKKILSISVLLIAVLALKAQLPEDAYRASENMYSGSARYNAMGGAMSAFGGDLSALTVNPAGIGTFRKGVFEFTPQFTWYDQNTAAFGESFNDFDYSLTLNQIGFITGYTSQLETGWVSVNFGINYNKLADFRNESYNFSVLDQNYTIVQQYVDDANYSYQSGNELDDFNGGLAYNAYLLEFDPNSDEYYSYVTDEWVIRDTLIANDIERSVNTNGRLGEYNIVFGGNYAHKVYIGGAIGIRRLKFSYDINHFEDDYYNNINIFDNTEIIEKGSSEALGTNLKLGMIVRPVSELRLGLAIHTPTIYSFEDEFSRDIYTAFDADSVKEAYSDLLVSEYNLKTPMRTIVSVGYQLGKLGIVNVEYELVNYSGMRLRTSEIYNYDFENDEINTLYTLAHNLRVGAEANLGFMALRGGFAYYDSPYRKAYENATSDKMVFSGGVGFNSKDVYFDMAFGYVWRTSKTFIYASDAIGLNNDDIRISATLGFRF